MGNLTVALTFVMILNALMFLTQLAVIDLNPDGNIYIYNNTGTLIDEFADEDVLDNRDTTIKGNYPQSAIIEPSSGNPFTDAISSIKNWFSNVTGLKYAKAIVSGPYNILRSMNLPTSFAITIAGFWYGLTLFLVVAFFWGKE